MTIGARKPRKPRARKGKGIMDILGKVNGFLKSTKLLSTVGNLIPDPRAKAAGTVASALGYGRKPRKPRAKKGKGIMDIISSLFGGKKHRAKRSAKLF